MLEVRDLHVSVDGVPILKGLSLVVRRGEVHAIMGPNGSGKSTLTKVIAGHPAYEVTGGEILLDGANLLEEEADARARLGVFLAFQYPVEIPGVSNKTFLRQSYNAVAEARGWDELDPLEFEDYLEDRLGLVDMDPAFLERSVNAGFSGGEKKRNEILQMAVLRPQLALLDETDSGLDIDALRTVAGGINALSNEATGVLLVTHYQRLLDYVKPGFVHVLAGGRIIRSGGPELAEELEVRGYSWLVEGGEA